MELWEKIIKICATVAGAIAGVLGDWDVLLTILAIVMSLDYASGLLVAFSGKSPKSEGGLPSSRAGFIGLAKKGFIVIVVLLATTLDKALGNEGTMFQTATCCYYIANESISILENAGLVGLPVPPIIRRALEQLQEKDDK